MVRRTTIMIAVGLLVASPLMARKLTTTQIRENTIRINALELEGEKAEKVEEWCQEYFGCDFNSLTNCIGVRKDIYDYDTYCSLWETSSTDKFTEDELGLIDEAVIKEIKLDDVGIKIHIEYEGKIYENKMVYAKWVDGMKKFFVNPQEKTKKMEQFKNKFGVSIDNKEELIGKTVMFEVKKAGGKFIWVDIKPLVKKNKKK